MAINYIDESGTRRSNASSNTTPRATSSVTSAAPRFEENAVRDFSLDSLMNSIGTGLMGGLGAGGGGGGGGSSKKFALKNLDLEQEELLRQRDAALRDAEIARREGLRAAVNDALQRNVYRSGITTMQKGRVNEAIDNEVTDIREKIRIALEQMANRRAQIKAGGGGGGGFGGGGLEEYLNRLFGALEAWGVGGFRPKSEGYFAIQPLMNKGRNVAV